MRRDSFDRPGASGVRLLEHGGAAAWLATRATAVNFA